MMFCVIIGKFFDLHLGLEGTWKSNFLNYQRNMLLKQNYINITYLPNKYRFFKNIYRVQTNLNFLDFPGALKVSIANQERIWSAHLPLRRPSPWGPRRRGPAPKNSWKRPQASTGSLLFDLWRGHGQHNPICWYKSRYFKFEFFCIARRFERTFRGRRASEEDQNVLPGVDGGGGNCIFETRWRGKSCGGLS